MFKQATIKDNGSTIVVIQEMSAKDLPLQEVTITDNYSTIRIVSEEKAIQNNIPLAKHEDIEDISYNFYSKHDVLLLKEISEIVESTINNNNAQSENHLNIVINLYSKGDTFDHNNTQIEDPRDMMEVTGIVHFSA